MAAEQWFVVNLTAKSFTVGVPGTPSLTRFSRFDLLLYTDKQTVCETARVRTLIENKQISLEKYVDGVLKVIVTDENVDASLCEAVVVPPEDDTVTREDLETKADKVVGASEDHLAAITATGNIKDSGVSPDDFAASGHTHSIGQVEGLQPALDGKVDDAALAAHVGDHSNPHQVTAGQTGAYTKAETDELLDGKADDPHCHQISDIDGLLDILAGFSGYSGGPGTPGASGFSGASGYSGSPGAPGAAGASGTSGFSGYSGAAGAGFSGFSGFSGYSGHSGISSPLYERTFNDTSDWTDDGDEHYYIDFAHNLASTNIVPTSWDTDSGNLVYPTYEALSINSLRLLVAKRPGNRFNGRLVINGGGQSGYSGYSASLAFVRVNGTTSIGGPQINARDSGESAGTAFTAFAGSQVVLMTKEVTLLSAGTQTITLPSGAKFWIDEMGVICTSYSSVSSQPFVSFGNTGDTEKQHAPTQTSSLTGAGRRSVFVPLVSQDGETTLTASVSTAAVGGTMKGRFYWKGLLIEDE